jgi:hypothetical protein
LKIDEIGSPPNDLGDECVPHGFGPVESLGLTREVLEESVVAYAAETFSVGAYGVVGGPLFVAFTVWSTMKKSKIMIMLARWI